MNLFITNYQFIQLYLLNLITIKLMVFKINKKISILVVLNIRIYFKPFIQFLQILIFNLINIFQSNQYHY